MIKNKSYSFYSVLFSIVGLIFLIITYTIAPDQPAGIVKIVMFVTMGLAIILLISGIVVSIIAMKRKELGTGKYFGILIPIFIGLFFILMPLMIGIGFIINDRP